MGIECSQEGIIVGDPHFSAAQSYEVLAADESHWPVVCEMSVDGWIRMCAKRATLPKIVSGAKPLRRPSRQMPLTLETSCSFCSYLLALGKTDTKH